MTMSCVDGPGYQCSGGTAIRTENGITLTSSGVQAYGRSTSDLATPIVIKTSAFGLAPASGGLAEIRIAKDGSGNVTDQALLLKDLGLTWDGRTERPLIIETFRPTAGRVALDASGALIFGGLPASSDLGFYDYATKGAANATQGNYANNRYFPRSGNPSRCEADVVPCPTMETTGVRNNLGDWRSGGTTPDWTGASRLHEDGDVHAGDGLPGPNGTFNPLPGGNGPGVPFPGSKGYRSFANWGMQYANLASWETQDTVVIEEWAMMGNEHNKNRRGIVAFGDVTTPSAVPTTGTATYSGFSYGWYSRNGAEDPSVFRGAATMTVNFATRQVTVNVQNATTYDSAGTPVPVSFTTTTTMGAANANASNYLTGTIDNGTLRGGVSGRYFGPVATAGGGAGPAELGGAFTLSNTTSGAIAVGGFLARKQ